MKKLSLVASVCLFLTFSIRAQTADTGEQTKALTEIGNLNGQIISLYKEKKYDEALKIALNIWEISDKNNLSKDLRALPALTNLGEIYLAKGKESEAIAVFQKILEAYQSNSGDMRLSVVKMTERIAVSYYYKENYGKAEEFFLKALPLREALNGTESRETAKTNKTLGDIYRKKEQYDKADGFYRKAIEINDKILTKDEKEKRDDIENYKCFLYHKALREDKIKEVSQQLKDFNDSRNPPKTVDKTVDSGIINGKAINLVKPQYPPNVRGANGFVLVQVTIDEQGNVIEAKATCGILEFVKAVEDAAKKSKFSPTILKGQPIKVTGIIVYNFVR
jgi:Tetratricopeptide repeat/Gram-negative bacterial TonB protein C-terminal